MTIFRAKLVAFWKSSAEQHRDAIYDLRARHQIAVFSRQLHGDAERHAAWNDGDLVQRVGVGQHLADQRVAAFVIGDDLFLAMRDYAALALRTRDDAVDGLFAIGHVDGGLV